jgi:hypothetical protein
MSNQYIIPHQIRMIGEPVLFLSAERQRPNQPRPAVITGFGDSPGLYNLSVSNDILLDVAKGLTPLSLVRNVLVVVNPIAVPLGVQSWAVVRTNSAPASVPGEPLPVKWPINAVLCRAILAHQLGMITDDALLEIVGESEGAQVWKTPKPAPEIDKPATPPTPTPDKPKPAATPSDKPKPQGPPPKRGPVEMLLVETKSDLAAAFEGIEVKDAKDGNPVGRTLALTLKGDTKPLCIVDYVPDGQPDYGFRLLVRDGKGKMSIAAIKTIRRPPEVRRLAKLAAKLGTAAAGAGTDAKARMAAIGEILEGQSPADDADPPAAE